MESNQRKNIEHYNKLYKDTGINKILEKLNNLQAFLEDAIKTDTSWFGLYKLDFQNSIKDKKILELGCGDCTNAAIMAALGAQVYANDISPASGEIVKKLNESYNFKRPIVFIEGDFLKANFKEKNFDFVVGKAFLHHLTLSVERKFIQRIGLLLKENGEARFFEPAVNSRILDEIRWHIPVSGRPSKFNDKAFKAWKIKDPHPERDNSSKHFKKLGKEFFKEVEIICFGTLERFHKIMPKKINQRKFRRKALIMEQYLPVFLNNKFARSQLIIFRKPL